MLTEQQDRDVRRLIVSGWSHARIQSYILALHNVEVTAGEIDAIQEVVCELILPPSVLQNRFKGLDVEADPIGEMHRLLLLASERLGTSLNLEEINDTGRLPYTDTAMKTYWRMLTEFIGIQQSVGALPRKTSPTESVPIPVQQQMLPTLRALLVAKFDGPEIPSLEKSDAAYIRGSQVNTGQPAQKLLEE